MIDMEAIEHAKEHFGKILEEQLERVERMKKADDWIDYSDLKPILIGVVQGDGIGPTISREARRILEFLLKDAAEEGKVLIKTIDGLTIENRAKEKKAIPDDVLEQLKSCHVILKGPTTTPKMGDKWPNIESANVAIRRELDLFANVRPVKVSEQGIDWLFFRENTEGAYILGKQGINVTGDLAIDFKATTTQGTERIVRMAFDYARKYEVNRVTVVTKANVLKTTDGKFLDIARKVAAEYPEVEFDDWFIDIMTAKLIDPKRRKQFRVILAPNLYGDIITDEAAELQGGVGTAGSANIGKRYAMFEAVHGSAPRMVDENRSQYADPSSMLRASVMLLTWIGYQDRARMLARALGICSKYEKKLVITGCPDGATASAFAGHVMEMISDPALGEKWNKYH